MSGDDILREYARDGHYDRVLDNRELELMRRVRDEPML